MTTTGDGDQMSWTLADDTCKSNQTYSSNTVYIEECCIDPGFYMLICLDDNDDEWKSGSSIEIQGTKYCDPWMGPLGLSMAVTVNVV